MRPALSGRSATTLALRTQRLGKPLGVLGESQALAAIDSAFTIDHRQDGSDSFPPPQASSPESGLKTHFTESRTHRTRCVKVMVGEGEGQLGAPSSLEVSLGRLGLATGSLLWHGPPAQTSLCYAAVQVGSPAHQLQSFQQQVAWRVNHEQEPWQVVDNLPGNL